MTSMTNHIASNDTAERADRRECYLRYGFDIDSADRLADAKDGLWPLYHLKVKRALDAGMTRAQALEIFL